MLSVAIEVESPCTPTASGGCGGSVAEVADVLMYSVSTRSQYRGKEIAYNCENIVFIFRDAHCTNGVRKLMHKLGGVGSRIDLPDLGRVDQCHKKLAIGTNSDVLDPLQCKNVIVSDHDSEVYDEW